MRGFFRDVSRGGEDSFEFRQGVDRECEMQRWEITLSVLSCR